MRTKKTYKAINSDDVEMNEKGEVALHGMTVSKKNV